LAVALDAGSPQIDLLEPDQHERMAAHPGHPAPLQHGKVFRKALLWQQGGL